MEISFSRLGQFGRLGNQLFEIAGTLGLAEKYNATASFPEWPYEKYFIDLPHGEMQTNQVKEQHFHYHDWNLTESCDILGYLQSEKYFGSQKLQLKKEFVDNVKSKVDWFNKPTICFQIRRGDYVGNPNYFQLSINYYIDALLTYFPDWRDYNIIFFSDDIEYCRNHFECLPNAFFTAEFNDIEQMALSSCCDHFIIPNSSFGWWCAWLGEKEHSKVIHCGHLQAGRLLEQNDPKDYYPERWIRHQKDSYKIPLKDVTFTIPLHYDHIDRKKNADLSLCLLQIAFDAEFIVSEQGSDKFEYMSPWVKYMKFEGDVFHRTKMLNDMANEAQTDIIVNWDCDVIIPPMQVYIAVETLRNGADVVFPYDGRFGRMPRKTWFEAIQKHLDVGIVGNAKLKGREEGHNSVGGCVMFNKDSFIEGGMENENFISFGPEDCERNDRFKKLGYDVRMTPGSLFHMDHYCGLNSGKANPHFKANHEELEKIRLMTKEELMDYVDTWPWVHKYTSRYYHRISQGAIKSAKIVMDALSFKPHSVIDIGCGVGEWNNGNSYYYGVDYRVKKKDLLFDTFLEADLNKTFPTIQIKFDLALCLEVAEHLRPHRAEPLVEFLCSLSDKVLFSAAVPAQGGTGHVNEQWQTYWADKFSKYGFYPALEQPDIRNNKEVELWYRNNLVLYERGGKGKVCDFILPEYYMEIVGNLLKQSA